MRELPRLLRVKKAARQPSLRMAICFKTQK
jgi:hypothetical protein